jgi:SAM-dependent methyltransferase
LVTPNQPELCRITASDPLFASLMATSNSCHSSPVCTEVTFKPSSFTSHTKMDDHSHKQSQLNHPASSWRLYVRIVYETLQAIVVFFALWVKGLAMVLIPSSWQHKDITDQVAVVTGAGSGLGRGLCLRLAEQGARVVAIDINAEAVAETVRMVKEGGGHAYDFVCDISNAKKVMEMANQVSEQVGSVDLLFNNAGVVSGHRFLEITEEDVQRTFAVNTFAHFWVSHLCLSSPFDFG